MSPEPVVDKALIDTDVTDSANEGDEATIGEIITYEVTLTLTEGISTSAAVVDQLGAGLEFVDIISVAPTINSNITTDLSGGFGSVTGTTAGDPAGGQTVTINLGNLTIAGDNTGEFPSTIGDDLQGAQILRPA